MSRRRNRSRRPADFVPPGPPAGAGGPSGQPSAPFAFSRHVRLDMSRLEIPDLKTFALAQSAASDEAALTALLPSIIDMLERIVVGGLGGRPSTEFWPLVEEVGKQLQSQGNPKNSTAGS